MHSKITSKYQTTIPKEVRDKLKVSVSDTLEWKFVEGRLVVEPSKPFFQKYRGFIKVGEGDISEDLKKARESMAKRFS